MNVLDETSSAATRQAMLLAVVTEKDGEWTPPKVHQLYRALGIAPNLATARNDLKTLARRGYLTLHETPGRRYFTRCVKEAAGA
ncbi:hypothetical protein [Streptomyces sp. NPDC053048]|uniref:hypothetical protein n=1 Tax=Streptomyces sp. NPDC053048 TaxID=3365694 RepID=UPI0037CFDE4B